jgi:hypothetical protein
LGDNPYNERKIFACSSTNKGLIFIIYKELKKLNTKGQIIQSINGQMNSSQKK